MDHIAVDGEGTIAAVMNGFRILLRRIDPGFDDSRMQRLYLATKCVSVTLHSRLAKYSPISGGFTRAPGTGVSPDVANLSVSRP
jgi:hypothetical protein